MRGLQFLLFELCLWMALAPGHSFGFIFSGLMGVGIIWLMPSNVTARSLPIEHKETSP